MKNYAHETYNMEHMRNNEELSLYIVQEGVRFRSAVSDEENMKFMTRILFRMYNMYLKNKYTNKK